MRQVEEKDVALPHPAMPDADWADCYRVEGPLKFETAHQAAAAIVSAFPKWTYPALMLRQIVVMPFGLKGSEDKPDQIGKIGIFPIVSQEPERVVAGINDKHLNFRIVVDLEEGHAVSLTTLIRRHNLLGRAYLQLVLPFHRAIIRSALAKFRA